MDVKNVKAAGIVAAGTKLTDMRMVGTTVMNTKEMNAPMGEENRIASW